MNHPNQLHRLIMTALLTAITAVLSIIAIPTPWGVPFTLQTFAIALCGCLLGKKDGTVAVLLYLMLGLVLPVYSGGGSGFGWLMGMTGGYLFGFLPMAFLCGVKKDAEKLMVRLLMCLLGLFTCHLWGSVQFALISGRGFFSAFLLASAPYLVKDVISLFLADVVAQAVQMALKKSRAMP